MLTSFLTQGPGPGTTAEFYNWYFFGISGLGGWFVFFLLGVAPIFWLLYDSQKRRLPVTGWRIAIIGLAALILPSIIWRFSGSDTQSSLEPVREAIFYLGLLGGVLPPVVAIGYYVTFQGLVACDKGHIYEAVLGRCPECARAERPIVPEMPARLIPSPPPSPPPVREEARPKPKAQAWLVGNGRNYQLNQGETTIGRHSTNDIQLTGDPTIGRQHAKIVEQNGHFRLYDLGSKNGTRVNGRLIRQPIELEHGDEIQFGDSTILRLVTSGR